MSRVVNALETVYAVIKKNPSQNPFWTKRTVLEREKTTTTRPNRIPKILRNDAETQTDPKTPNNWSVK